MTRIAAMALWVALVIAAHPAASQEPGLTGGDFAMGNAEWNGMSRLLRLSAERGHPIEVSTSVDLNELTPEDRLIIVYPTQELPTQDLSSFVIDGGKVLLADDFGASEGFLERLGIKRFRAASVQHREFFLSRPGLPMFKPGGKHPLLTGVKSVVANHPAALSTRGGAILPYLDEAYGLVYDMRLAEGKVIVLGDSSLLINHMLEVRDNRQFVSNAIDYLCRGVEEDCSPILLVGEFTLSGSYTPTRSPDEDVSGWLGGALDQLNEALEQLDDYVPPHNAVYYASLLLMGGVVVFLLTIFPVRRASDVEPDVGPPPGVAPLSEFEWNLQRFERLGHQANYALPVAILKSEFERLFFQEMAPGEPVPPVADSARWAFLRRLAKRYVDRVAPEDNSAGNKVKLYKQTLTLLTTFSKLPPRHRLFLDSEASFSERDMMRIHDQCREILGNLGLGEDYERRIRRGRPGRK